MDRQHYDMDWISDGRADENCTKSRFVNNATRLWIGLKMADN